MKKIDFGTPVISFLSSYSFKRYPMNPSTHVMATRSEYIPSITGYSAWVCPTEDGRQISHPGLRTYCGVCRQSGCKRCNVLSSSAILPKILRIYLFRLNRTRVLWRKVSSVQLIISDDPHRRRACWLISVDAKGIARKWCCYRTLESVALFTTFLKI